MLFRSLRPENIHFAAGTALANVVHFRARLRTRIFHGATELLQAECADGLVLSLRTASYENRHDDLDLEFAPSDAIPVRESDELKKRN